MAELELILVGLTIAAVGWYGLTGANNYYFLPKKTKAGLTIGAFVVLALVFWFAFTLIGPIVLLGVIVWALWKDSSEVSASSQRIILTGAIIAAYFIAVQQAYANLLGLTLILLMVGLWAGSVKRTFTGKQYGGRRRKLLAGLLFFGLVFVGSAPALAQSAGLTADQKAALRCAETPLLAFCVRFKADTAADKIDLQNAKDEACKTEVRPTAFGLLPPVTFSDCPSGSAPTGITSQSTTLPSTASVSVVKEPSSVKSIPLTRCHDLLVFFSSVFVPGGCVQRVQDQILNTVGFNGKPVDRTDQRSTDELAEEHRVERRNEQGRAKYPYWDTLTEECKKFLDPSRESSIGGVFGPSRSQVDICKAVGEGNQQRTSNRQDTSNSILDPNGNSAMGGLGGAANGAAGDAVNVVNTVTPSSRQVTFYEIPDGIDVYVNNKPLKPSSVAPSGDTRTYTGGAVVGNTVRILVAVDADKEVTVAALYGQFLGKLSHVGECSKPTGANICRAYDFVVGSEGRYFISSTATTFHDKTRTWDISVGPAPPPPPPILEAPVITAASEVTEGAQHVITVSGQKGAVYLVYLDKISPGPDNLVDVINRNVDGGAQAIYNGACPSHDNSVGFGSCYMLGTFYGPGSFAWVPHRELGSNSPGAKCGNLGSFLSCRDHNIIVYAFMPGTSASLTRTSALNIVDAVTDDGKAPYLTITDVIVTPAQGKTQETLFTVKATADSNAAVVGFTFLFGDICANARECRFPADGLTYAIPGFPATGVHKYGFESVVNTPMVVTVIASVAGGLTATKTATLVVEPKTSSSVGSDCSAGYVYDGTKCVSACPTGSTWNGQTCVTSCPSGTQWDGTKCASNTPTCQTGYTWNGAVCAAPTCPTGSTWDGAKCAEAQAQANCPEGQYWDGTTCTSVPTLNCNTPETFQICAELFGYDLTLKTNSTVPAGGPGGGMGTLALVGAGAAVLVGLFLANKAGLLRPVTEGIGRALQGRKRGPPREEFALPQISGEEEEFR